MMPLEYDMFDEDTEIQKLRREYESLYIAYITTLEDVLRSQYYALRIAKGEIDPPTRTKDDQIKHLEEKIRGFNQQKLSADIAKRRSNE